MTPMLVLLWLSWSTLLFGGFVFGRPAAPGARRMPTWARMASSCALVLAAWTFAWNAPGSTPLLLMALGMSLGLVGDLFMAGLIVRGDSKVFGGIGAFGLGHVAYIAALWTVGEALGLTATGPRWGALIAAWTVGVVAWFLILWRPAREHGTLHWVALVYALLLASTLGIATGLALQMASFWPVALGALLFLVSDMVLAAQLFNGLRFRLIDDVIWLLYGPGQMLIVYGLGLALIGA